MKFTSGNDASAAKPNGMNARPKMVSTMASYHQFNSAASRRKLSKVNPGGGGGGGGFGSARRRSVGTVVGGGATSSTGTGFDWDAAGTSTGTTSHTGTGGTGMDGTCVGFMLVTTPLN